MCRHIFLLTVFLTLGNLSALASSQTDGALGSVLTRLPRAAYRIRPRLHKSREEMPDGIVTGTWRDL